MNNLELMVPGTINSKLFCCCDFAQQVNVIDTINYNLLINSKKTNKKLKKGVDNRKMP